MKVDGPKLLEEFRRHLAEHNLPATQHRAAVAEAGFAAGERLSAEEVGRLVSSRVAVGTATIYRTLDLLVRAGLAKEHDFGEGFKRYEPLAAGQAHEHCICSSCGRVTEFANDRLERMIALLAEEVEFRPHHHRLEIYGLCRSCQQTTPLPVTSCVLKGSAAVSCGTIHSSPACGRGVGTPPPPPAGRSSARAGRSRTPSPGRTTSRYNARAPGRPRAARSA